MNPKTQHLLRTARAQGVRLVVPTVDIAIMRAAKISASRRNATMEPVTEALDAMRRAQGTVTDWLALCTAMHVLRALDSMGVMGSTAHYTQAASDTLDAIGNRCEQPGRWTPTALHATELQALRDLRDIWRTALAVVSNGELTDAEALAVSRVASARGTVLDGEKLAGMEAAGVGLGAVETHKEAHREAA